MRIFLCTDAERTQNVSTYVYRKDAYPLRILNRGWRKKGNYVQMEILMHFFKIALFFLARQFKVIYYWTKTNAFTPESESYHKAEDVQLVSAVA